MAPERAERGGKTQALNLLIRILWLIIRLRAGDNCIPCHTPRTLYSVNQRKNPRSSASHSQLVGQALDLTLERHVWFYLPMFYFIGLSVAWRRYL